MNPSKKPVTRCLRCDGRIVWVWVTGTDIRVCEDWLKGLSTCNYREAILI